MFWRFGFHNASSIDSLLDKDDVLLESILDEDDLLQECKAQNTRLMDYFQRIDVLQRLLHYVTGEIEGEEKGRFKYPYVATEVLCSEIWSIVETSINRSDEVLGPFWDTVLNRSVDDMKTQTALVSRFTRINTVFLNKKPNEMFAFIRSQPNIVDRLLFHLRTPSVVDLLVRIIQLDEEANVSGVLEWFSAENLLSRLITMLAPSYSPDTHAVVSDLIKGIISLAAPSPGAGVTDSQPNALASNQFARELARRDGLMRLVNYILDGHRALASTVAHLPTGEPLPEDAEGEAAHQAALESSLISSLSVIVELIRKNNSDYFEPYLFHTLRNKLIQVQQHLPLQENGRDALEHAMNEMVSRVGVVHLGTLLEVLCEYMDVLQSILKDPRPLSRMPTTAGTIRPLGFQRYRICELYAELIHCSNMSLLNRSSDLNSLYDTEGRLQGGLVALEKLARIVTIGSSGTDEDERMDNGADEVQPAMELPISSGAHDMASSLDLDDDLSDEETANSSDDEAMADAAIHESPLFEPTAAKGKIVLTKISSPFPMSSSSMDSLPDMTVPQKRKSSGSLSDPRRSPTRPRSSGSRRNSRRLDSSSHSLVSTLVTPGDLLKRRFVELNVFSTLLDLFFEFQRNNFLHSVTYDMIHQTVTGRTDRDASRELIVSLFRDSKLLYRIIAGQEKDDVESGRPKASRLGYMGHLTLITEDVITALNHYPADLQAILDQYTPQPAWNTYVNGVYAETKKKDNALLGGGKPVLTMAASSGGGGQRWKVDEEDTAVPVAVVKGFQSQSPVGDNRGMKGEFRRATSNKLRREGSADFGVAPFMQDEDDEDGPPQFARYLAEEMQATEAFNNGSSSDEEDEEGGWLAHSHFDISAPPLSSPLEHGSDANGFDDTFAPSGGSAGSSDDAMSPSSDYDDAFGPFSDAAAASGTDPFTFSNRFADEGEDVSFDSFGDFGEFQAASDGETTPTGSWTFASRTSLDSDSEDGGSGSGGGTPLKERLEHITLDEERRT